MRLTKDQKERIRMFFEGLEKFSYQGIFDMGLVLIKQKSDPKNLFPQKDFEAITINRDSYIEEVLAKILNALNQKKWIVINLEDGTLPARIYNQLRLLSSVNRIQILNLTGKNEVNLKQPKETRIVVITAKDNLEKIPVPTFMGLFGPVADLS